MNKGTRELIKHVYSLLDYSLTFENRKKVVEQIANTYMVELCNKLYYYRRDGMTYEKITHCMDAVNNYLLFAKDCECETEYTYTTEDNFKLNTGGKFKTTHKMGNESPTKYKVVKNTIQSYLERDDVPKYIYDYINYMESTRALIAQVENQIKDMGKPISDLHMFFYATPTGKNKTILYKDYIRLRKITGYTKNNSIVFDQEILFMLQNHYEPMNSKSNTENVWIDTFQDIDSGEDFDIDLMDEESMACLIKAICFYGESPLFDIYFSQIDELVGMTKLNKIQLDIYSILKEGRINNQGSMEKIPLGAIATVLNKDRKQINRYFDTMVRALVQEYERVFESNVYYMDLVKGKYKTCTCCGEVLPATENNFYKDSKGQFGLRAECKTCFQKDS